MDKTIISKSILITGCSSGIGLHVALGLQKRGHMVIASARQAEDVDRLRSMGLDTIQLDLNDSVSIGNAVASVAERTSGYLDALFNNAGYGQPGAVEDLNVDVLRDQFETNVFGTQELTNLIIPMMRKQGDGRIIQNSSVLGVVTLPYRGAYNASKFALEALSDTMRLELQGTGIYVSLIEPGPIESLFRENAFKAYLENINSENSKHQLAYAALENRLTKEGAVVPFTLPPEAVLTKVIHALESDRPKIRYYVTFPTYLFATLKRLLPHWLMDKVLMQVSKKENA